MGFHNKEIKDVFQELSTSEKGLTSEQAQKRTARYGKNEIAEEKKRVHSDFS